MPQLWRTVSTESEPFPFLFLFFCELCLDIRSEQWTMLPDKRNKFVHRFFWRHASKALPCCPTKHNATKHPTLCITYRMLITWWERHTLHRWQLTSQFSKVYPKYHAVVQLKPHHLQQCGFIWDLKGNWHQILTQSLYIWFIILSVHQYFVLIDKILIK